MKKVLLVLHKFKTVFFYSVASVIIIIALGVSGLRLMLTTANLYQEEVEQLASTLLEQPVKIGRMDAELSGFVPTLIFHDVEITSPKTKQPVLFLARVDVGLSVDVLLFQQHLEPSYFVIKGLDVNIQKKMDGSINVENINLGAISGTNNKDKYTSFLREFLKYSDLSIQDSNINWHDEQDNNKWKFSDVNVYLRNKVNRHQFSLSSKLPSVLGKKINLEIDLEGDITAPETWDSKIYIESADLNLKPIKKYINNKRFALSEGLVNLKLWLNWKDERIEQLSGDVNLHDISYGFNEYKKVNLKKISGIFDSRKNEKGAWNVSVDKFNYESDAKVLNESTFSVAFDFKEESINSFDIIANYLDLGTISKIVTDNHLVKQEYENIINQIGLRGEIHDFSIGWKENKLHAVKADFNGFGVNAWKDIPKIAGLTGKIIYKKEKGEIALSSKNTIIGFPNVFREDFKFEKIDADIAFSNTKEGLLFETKKLSISNSEVEATSSAKLWLPKNNSSPHLDLQTYISKGDISKVSHFLPVSIMSKDLVNWLDQGLQQGRVDKATVVLNGKINDFPFDNKEGGFAVEVEASDFTLNYRKGWPKITNAKVNSVFTGQGLKVHLLSGESKSNVLYDSRAEIESYLNADLNLNISATGSSHSMVQYLVNSPILPKSKKVINTMRFIGDVGTTIKVNIPLGDEVAKEKPLSYAGTAEFSNTSIFMVDDKIDITNGSGKLFFTEKGLSGEKLTANIFEEKAQFSVSSNIKNKDIKVAIKGNIEPDVVWNRFDIPGAKNISGKTAFRAKMIFPDTSKVNNKPVLKVSSNLLGIKSHFPDFFSKKKKSTNKFYFETVFSGSNKIQFFASLDDYGSSVIELDQSGKDSYLNKGAISFSDNKAILPNKNIFYVDGSINTVTPSLWFDALELHKVKRKTPFFVNPIIFNLDSLKVLTLKKDQKIDTSQVTNPKRLPAFEGIVKKFYFDDVFLGRLDFKVSPNKHGLHFDEVILSAKNMKLFSHGDWEYKGRSHKTKLDLTLSSGDFGGMLNDLGFSAVIRKGEAQASGKLNWWGAPTQFRLNKLNGDIQLKIENGNIKEVDAGAGRLLGLFSLSALPRKLFGDFNDTFKSGFSFDVAEGAINIEEGDAYTDDFEISSPVAEVAISGRTGLADRDYENTVEVIPDVGGGLAGLTALLVNLPAGIGLWLVDKITGEQFNEASSKMYEVSGSWELPEIEQIEEN